MRGARKRAKQTGQKQGRALTRKYLAPRMSGPGLAFLKCAFASPDFSRDPGQGIPDAYNGKSLGVKNTLTMPYSFSSNADTYIVVMPTPGVAFWHFSVSAGKVLTSSDVVLTPVLYPGYTSMFGDPASGFLDRAQQVTKFRYASTAVGLYPTCNMMSYNGSVQAWKAAITFSREMRSKTIATTPVTNIDIYEPIVTGLEALGAPANENYADSYIHGLYSVATNSQPDFEFVEIQENLGHIPAVFGTTATDTTGTSMWGSLRLDTSVQTAVGTGGTAIAGVGDVFLGLGTQEAIIIKVTNSNSSAVGAVLKLWACLEYQVNSNSALYQFAGHSPPLDPVALELYRKISSEIPVGVSCDKNASFWQFVSGIIKRVAAVASYMPGPVGLVGTGVSAAIAGIEAMAL